MKKNLIFIIDDDIDFLQATASHLQDCGYDVVAESDGSTALDKVKTVTPDLFIIDLRMQPMNGFEVYQHIRNLPQFSETPVFFLTAVDDPLSQRYSIKLGVDAYLTKPIDLVDLENAIKKKIK